MSGAVWVGPEHSHTGSNQSAQFTCKCARPLFPGSLGCFPTSSCTHKPYSGGGHASIGRAIPLRISLPGACNFPFAAPLVHRLHDNGGKEPQSERLPGKINLEALQNQRHPNQNEEGRRDVLHRWIAQHVIGELCANSHRIKVATAKILAMFTRRSVIARMATTASTPWRNLRCSSRWARVEMACV